MRSSPDRPERRVIKAERLVPRHPGPADPKGARTAPEHSSPGDHILQVARQVARATLATAQRDAEATRKAAEREGRRSGFERGRQEGYNEGLAQAEQEARSVLEEAGKVARDIVAQASENVGTLACEIAAHLLGASLRLNPEVVERAVLEVLQDSVQAGPVSIAVARADYPRALQAIPRFRAALGGRAAEVRVVEDPELPQGGFRISGPHGVVERNWQDGLMAISEAFEEVASRGV